MGASTLTGRVQTPACHALALQYCATVSVVLHLEICLMLLCLRTSQHVHLYYWFFYRPWVKKHGPYDHTPKRPESGTTLHYFSAEEGHIAVNTDPLLKTHATISRHSLPPAKPLQSASPGKSSREIGTWQLKLYTKSRHGVLFKPVDGSAAGPLWRMHATLLDYCQQPALWGCMVAV